jgi:hypothetical protein
MGGPGRTGRVKDDEKYEIKYCFFVDHYDLFLDS